MTPRSTGRLAAEFVVIVAGVLIALGAEAWWAGRQEAAAERDFLVLARTEIADLEAELRETLETEQENQRALTDEARKIQAGDPDEPVMAGFTASTPQPRLGALRQIDGVRGPILATEPRLRAEIGSLASSTDSGMELMASFFSDIVGNLRSALVEIAEIQTETRRPLTVADFRDSPELGAAVSFHLIALQNRIGLLSGLLAQTEQTLAHLDEILEREGIPIPGVGGEGTAPTVDASTEDSPAPAPDSTASDGGTN
jgi:hypothetical protein